MYDSHCIRTIGISLWKRFHIDGNSTITIMTFAVAPVCKEAQRFVYGVSKHESVAIHCQVDSDPEQVSFRWAFNTSDGKLKDITEGFTTSSGGRSTLVYRPLSEEDYGQLLCWATNSVGLQRQPCAYTIVTAGESRAAFVIIGIRRRPPSHLDVYIEYGIKIQTVQPERGGSLSA